MPLPRSKTSKGRIFSKATEICPRTHSKLSIYAFLKAAVLWNCRSGRASRSRAVTDRPFFTTSAPTISVDYRLETAARPLLQTLKGRLSAMVLSPVVKTNLFSSQYQANRQRVAAHFDRYIIREDVQVADTTPNRSYLLLAGDSPARSARAGFGTYIVVWTRIATATCKRSGESGGHTRPLDSLGPIWTSFLRLTGNKPKRHRARARKSLVNRDLAFCDMPAFQALRIEAGTPLFGVDFDDRNFPQEVGRNEQAISFTKGCYLGQETVARIDALGHVNQQLAGVRFVGAGVPDAGIDLTHAGKGAGHVTSATFSPQLQAPLALAMLRREHAGSGSLLESPVGPCEVIPLPVSFTRLAQDCWRTSGN